MHFVCLDFWTRRSYWIGPKFTFRIRTYLVLAYSVAPSVALLLLLLSSFCCSPFSVAPPFLLLSFFCCSHSSVALLPLLLSFFFGRPSSSALLPKKPPPKICMFAAQKEFESGVLRTSTAAAPISKLSTNPKTRVKAQELRAPRADQQQTRCKREDVTKATTASAAHSHRTTTEATSSMRADIEI